MATNYVGAHISREKTIIKTMENIKNAGGNSLQIFVSNPRSTSLVNIENYLTISSDIKKYLNENNFKLIIHSPYVINIASELKINKRALPIEECYWIKLILHELIIADLIGSEGVVLHVGKFVKQSYKDGLDNMKKSIEFILDNMIFKKLNTKLIIETPAGQGTELLTDLNDFVDFHNSFSKEQQRYMGMCFDTAHTWALGYELDEAFKILFSKTNAKNVILIHLNNSLVSKGARKDRHAVMLNGTIPNSKMNNFISSLKKYKPIIILETPSQSYNEEFSHIYKLLS
jgi:apurinic endonuclease APN1|tara:strand:+ start:1815 stop:2675 length:861 start_codon:yes stop_codon:yes gene_type:complete